jgi:hypothetical protein
MITVLKPSPQEQSFRRRLLPMLPDRPRTKLDEWYEAQESIREQERQEQRRVWKDQDKARFASPIPKDPTLDSIWVCYIWRDKRWLLGGFMRYRRRRHHAIARNIRWTRRRLGVAKDESICIKTLGDAKREGPPLDAPQRRPSHAPATPIPSALEIHKRPSAVPFSQSPYMNLKRLLAPALVVPAVRSWGCPRLLVKGTVVAYMDAKALQSKPSPVEFPGEQLIGFSDEKGNLRPGWLAKGTKVGIKKTSEAKFKTPMRQVSGDGEDEMSAYDKLRDYLWRRKMTVRRWWRGKIARKAVPRPMLRKAIRELGGEPFKTDGTRELQKKLLLLLGSTLPQTSKEGTMAAKKAVKKTAKSRKPVKATRSRKQVADDEDYEDEEEEDEDELEDSYEEDEDEDEEEEDNEDEDDEDEEDERPRRRTAKKAGSKKMAKKAAKRASSNGTHTSMVSSVGRQVLQFGAAVKMKPDYAVLAKKMANDKPLSAKSYDKLVEHLRERRDNTKKLRSSDAAGLKKALRGLRMCQAKV